MPKLKGVMTSPPILPVINRCVSPIQIGHVLIEISIAQKKLNDKLEENFKKFHKEIISELEKKTELDVKYMNATLKRYQNEHRSKLDSLEKSQAELKKIRRKSQGARNAIKYEHRESEYLETVSSRQSDIQRFIAEGCREALLEEKKRFCFLVPETVMNMIDEIKSTGSVSISGTPLPSPMIERNNLVGNNYDSLRRHSPKVPPAPSGRAYTSPLVDMFNNPPVVPKTTSEKLNNAPDDSSLSRSTSVATGLHIMKRQKVKTIFPHTAGNNETLLSFAQGDLITLFAHQKRPCAFRCQDYALSGPTKPASEPKLETSRTTAAQGESISLKPNMNGIVKPPFLSGENPFASVKLRPTVTNDRSAPIIR
ncbi:putative Brain-specific angiogenesis inhibitor 1-associated protein [Naja naja]|nr:putative Brain-specific angiogenesis inhibitor 1-associated protein [Naja naja]